MTVKLKRGLASGWWGWCDTCHPNETDYAAHWQGYNAGMLAKRHAQLTGHTTHAIQEITITWEAA
jgi:hypothetical protein